MTEDTSSGVLGSGGFSQADLDRAAQQLAAVGEGPARVLEETFSTVAQSIAESLEGAAARGETSFRSMAEAIGDAVSESVGGAGQTSSLGAAVQTLVGALGGDVFGARADGGPVVSGGRYLVGERGPEVFTPAAAGRVDAPAAPVSVSLHVSGNGDVDAVRRSQGQIAAMVARAVARGRRDL